MCDRCKDIRKVCVYTFYIPLLMSTDGKTQFIKTDFTRTIDLCVDCSKIAETVLNTAVYSLRVNKNICLS